ncbi:STAS-like domain-containing protein [Haloferula sp.]|uniref:STAS-like domain-containing protein n=1 Tax=Haloferula sp. TaxID=2497595 RepID=UPI003C77A0D4
MKIQVRELTGELCMTYEDGEILLDRLREALAHPEIVELDFAGTRIHMSPYFNGSIAALLADRSLEELRRQLVIQNLPSQAVSTLQRCLEVAVEHYAKPEVRERLQKILDAHAAA